MYYFTEPQWSSQHPQSPKCTHAVAKGSVIIYFVVEGKFKMIMLY